ncbi:hypothetical protein [Erythrobacter mangrovi]|uniref:Secreted protein n=1 Tax=Erythrobacter mangrovi TaxID=2739433 RepID=A0A7D3XC54_9SPHN|nr:hypothetical protein [Erythrobacter mangrovi]QKG72150.1 hypothetical protein HQR01_12670 [Erythrobacter mangrovi]
MFWGKTLLTASALIGTTVALATAAQAGVVVKSSGPSAAQYPVGKKLDDAESVILKDGDSLTVLTNGGTRVLRGPGTQRIGARGVSKRTTFAMLTRQQSGARVRTGAVRGGATSGTAPANPSLWNVDVSQAGKVCLANSDSISFWRSDFAGAKTWVLGSEVSDFHVHVKFGDGDSTTALSAEELPLAENRKYRLSSPAGGPAQDIEFVLLDSAPDNPEDLAMALMQNGCDNQVELLSERMAD